MNGETRNAACVVVFNREGKILAASVRGEYNVFGLPGGKLEDNEKPIDAAIRELQEETGLVTQRGQLIQLYEGVDDGGYHVTTFRYVHTVESEAASQMERDINVQWVTPTELVNGRCGDYNNKVIMALLSRCYVINH